MDSSSESDDDLAFIQNINVRAERKFAERRNFLEELDEQEFSRRFRISKSSFKILLELIEGDISPQTSRYEYLTYKLCIPK